MREDMFAHAILTVAFQSVVAGHHPPLLFSLHHQVEELEAILVVLQFTLAVQEVQDAPEVCQEDQEEHQDHQRR